MLSVLKRYVDNDLEVTEYTQDGTSVSHIVRTPVQTEQPEVVLQEPKPTLEELQAQVLMNTEMLLIYSEFGM